VVDLLLSEVLTYRRKRARADRLDRVSFAPPQLDLPQVVSFLAADGRTAALEALDQSGDVGLRMEPHEEVNVARNHPHLEDQRTLIACHRPQESREEASHAEVYERGVFACVRE
jgi:hypothetical protein